MNKDLQQLVEAYQNILIKETADDEAQDKELHQQIYFIIKAAGVANAQGVADKVMTKVEAHVKKQIAALEKK